ncbi:hypothetical protein AYO44_16755 [Planctomycetaceae bacterium SCGC AG-212-F19]|nr:hypothetical protein AYO44_16755 [Planctomycetaceae bacterium SCGC AG-212-F19]
MNDWPFLAVLAVVVGAAWLLYRYLGRRRLEKLLERAERRGLSFLPNGDRALAEELKHTELLSHDSGRVTNLLRGKIHGVDTEIFDYTFQTGPGQYGFRGTSWHQQTVIRFTRESLVLPDFWLRPEGLWDKVAAAVGGEDINFPTHPEFSRKYQLHGLIEANVRRVFTPELLSFLETKTGLRIEGEPKHLVVFSAENIVQPEDIEELIQLGFQVLRLFDPTVSQGS